MSERSSRARVDAPHGGGSGLQYLGRSREGPNSQRGVALTPLELANNSRRVPALNLLLQVPPTVPKGRNAVALQLGGGGLQKQQVALQADQKAGRQAVLLMSRLVDQLRDQPAPALHELGEDFLPEQTT